MSKPEDPAELVRLAMPANAEPDDAGLLFFHGNYLAAEMVKAFLSSIEYRHRFGQ